MFIGCIENWLKDKKWKGKLIVDTIRWENNLDASNENFFTNENLTIKLTKTILQNVHEIVEVLKFHNNRTHNSTLALSWMIDYSPCKFWSPMKILNYQIYTYDTQRWPKSFGSWNSTKTGYTTTPSPSLEWLTPHLACFGDQWCQLVSFVL